MDDLEKNEILGDLYAYYGGLLTKSQKSYFEDYYYNDLSLGEIASNHHVSRQAVYDNLRRCRKLLKNYEDNLHMQRDYNMIEDKLTEVVVALKKSKSSQALQITTDLINQLRGE
ncbi:transcriptional regulator [Lactobacillus sp. M0398]|uniref:YlxM family DNA-binding protein n=1 Tax=unclassified Lactobacillus TaxID=2620435 RepID=UPI0018DE18A0|nr:MULTISPECIES: transcriptional regulator [unclassified Lactobacillus]MBI0121615.1 transcriptional regulator [Lactobacillus sp. M0398]MBI0122294.1 transcriptional regulator [Lactobacillus sp. W8174]MBI0134642.1 transcriptional regulator [Lactobacillus sp. W8173]